METDEYRVMYEIENDYWWYVGLRKLVFASIDRFASKEGKLKILDAGCGTGKILESCKEHDACGLDFSEEAISFCKKRGLNSIKKGSICDMPFPDNSFDVVISLDVLYHVNVEDDLKALKEIYRVANKDGILVLNLPAYKFLQSRHDEAIHTRHRYSYLEIKEKLIKAGFGIERLTYRNTILFPLAFVKRTMEKIFHGKSDKAESDLKPLPKFINQILTMLLFLENKMIMSGVDLPFGLSLYCVARKDGKLYSI